MSEEKPQLEGLFRDQPDTPEGKYLVCRRDGTVVEWPNFVLGGRDAAAAHALRAYATYGLTHGYNESYCKAIFKLAETFDTYREDHGQGDPDKGKHRKDDPETVEKMKKGWSA